MTSTPGPTAAGASLPAPDGQRDPPADTSLILDELRALHARLDELEPRFAPQEGTGLGSAPDLIPAWRRPTQGEARWQATSAVVAAAAVQLPLPGRLVLVQPDWLLPSVQGVLLVAGGARRQHPPVAPRGSCGPVSGPVKDVRLA